MKDFTDITLLVDRSGSMELIKTEMEQTLWELVQEHGKNKSTKVTLIQFGGSNTQDVRFCNVPAYAVEKEQLTIKPSGGTPLYDAFAAAIDNVGGRYAGLDESERPERVLFAVITDGQENTSRIRSAADVKTRVEKQRDSFKWQFVYLGANQDAIIEAERIGITRGNASGYNTDASSLKGLRSAFIGNTFSYASGVTGNAVPAFTDEQRVQMAAIEKSLSTR